MNDEIATPSADSYVHELMLADLETGLAKVRTLALEFDTTLQRCDRLRSEVAVFQQPREGVNYAELSERLEGALVSVSDWLAEWDLQPDSVQQGMRDWLGRALATLNLRNAQTVLEKCDQQLRETRTATEQVTKAAAKRQAEEARRQVKIEQQREHLEIQQAESERIRRDQEIQKEELEQRVRNSPEEYFKYIRDIVSYIDIYIEAGEEIIWPEHLVNKFKYNNNPRGYDLHCLQVHQLAVRGLETLRALKAGLLNLPPLPKTSAQRRVLIIAINNLKAKENLHLVANSMHVSFQLLSKELRSLSPSATYVTERGDCMDRLQSYHLFHSRRVLIGFEQLVACLSLLPVVDGQL